MFKVNSSDWKCDFCNSLFFELTAHCHINGCNRGYCPNRPYSSRSGNRQNKTNWFKNLKGVYCDEHALIKVKLI